MYKNCFRYEEVLSKLFGAKSGLTIHHKSNYNFNTNIDKI